MRRSVPHLLLTIFSFLPLLHSKLFLPDVVSFLSVFCAQWQGIDIFGGTYTRGEMLKLPFGLQSWNLLDFHHRMREAAFLISFDEGSPWREQATGKKVLGRGAWSRAERGCVISFWALCKGWVGVSISSRLRKVPRGCYSFVTSQKGRLTMRLIRGCHWRPGAGDFLLLLRAWRLATFITNKGKMKTKEPPSRSIPYLLTACTRQFEILLTALLS